MSIKHAMSGEALVLTSDKGAKTNGAAPKVKVNKERPAMASNLDVPSSSCILVTTTEYALTLIETSVQKKNPTTLKNHFLAGFQFLGFAGSSGPFHPT